MKLLRAALLLCLVLLWSMVSAAPAVPLASLPQGQGLSLSESGTLQWLPDADPQLGLDEVRSADAAGRFVPAPHPPRAQSTTRPHWFKIALVQPPGPGDWVLATHTTALQDVRFYGPFDAQARRWPRRCTPGSHNPLAPVHWAASATSCGCSCQSLAPTPCTCACSEAPPRR